MTQGAIRNREKTFLLVLFCISVGLAMWIGEGNGNPLQCSCLENPRDGGAWWAAVSGITQSQTWLKRLSKSSSHVKGEALNSLREMSEILLRPLTGSNSYTIKQNWIRTSWNPLCYPYYYLHPSLPFKRDQSHRNSLYQISQGDYLGTHPLGEWCQDWIWLLIAWKCRSFNLELREYAWSISPGEKGWDLWSLPLTTCLSLKNFLNPTELSSPHL